MSGYAEANTSEEPRGEETDLRIGERLIPEPLPPDPRQVWAGATERPGDAALRQRRLGSSSGAMPGSL